MDKIPMKYVVSTGKQQLCMAEADVPKCTKRRKREPTTTGMCFTDQRQHQLKVDQNAINCTAPKRSSRFRGVSRHRWTGRYEAHLWDKGSWNVTRKKKGKQVYLGAYDEEESAARAYDLAALKYWGATTTINFPASDYNEEIAIMQNITKEVYLASLRRKSSGFSRGVSKYRGVARHHHNGRWEARIGRVFGNKYLYLGTYGTQEEAARAYDIAAIEYRGSNAVTNFELSTYIRWLRPESNALVRSQEPQSHAQSQVFSEPSFVNTNNCTVDYLSSPQVFPRELPNMSSNGFSSPTALSLLLRSSLFKELVEKNSNSSEDEIETYNRRCQSQNGSPNTCSDSNSLLSDGTEEEVKSPFLINGNCYVQLGVSST